MENYVGKGVQMDDILYIVVKANNGDDACISLRNPDNGLFLRHKNGKIMESDSEDNAKFFPNDSSFVPVESGYGFILHCSNTGLERSFICRLEKNIYIISRDFVEYVFKPVPSQ